jgi:hypothetical protein
MTMMVIAAEPAHVAGYGSTPAARKPRSGARG